VPKAEAHRDTIEIKSGRSSGGIGIGSAGGLFYSGQTYYKKEKIWLCHDCYQARSRRRRIRVIGGVAILLIAGLAVSFFQGKSTDRSALVTPLQDTKLPLPSDIIAAQNRLIELGFLKGPPDGLWGAKSRTALRAFKLANGFTADDKWDDLVSGRLYSTQAARSPAPLATTGK
jgi:hypothetical protein